MNAAEEEEWEKIRFLDQPVHQAIVAQYSKDNREDLILLGELRRGFSPSQARWILGHARLWPLWERKLGISSFLFCDRLALEQSTAQDIALFKATLIPDNARVADLCCGMGGDSIFLPPHLNVVGVDLDPVRCAWYKRNTAIAGVGRHAVRGFAQQAPVHADFAMVDPARRSQQHQSRIRPEYLRPPPADLAAIVAAHAGCLLKLPPGLDTSELPFESTAIYIGALGDCREQLLLTGTLRHEPHFCEAVVIAQGGDVSRIAGIPAPFLDKEAAPPGAYLCEPALPLLRSHLYPNLGRTLGLWPLDASIAYLSGAQAPPPSPWWRTWRVVDWCPMGGKSVQNMLQKHDIGPLVLKKRGVEVDPQREILRLGACGTREGVLFYCRIQGRHCAILTQLLPSCGDSP